jgi:hypothetical protein
MRSMVEGAITGAALACLVLDGRVPTMTTGEGAPGPIPPSCLSKSLRALAMAA